MKKQTIKFLTTAVLILALVLSMNAIAFASSSDSEPGAYTMNGVAKSFIADTHTKATASVQSTSSGTTPYITSKMTLQSAPLGTKDYTNVSGVDVATKTVTDRVSITHVIIFPISADKDYRVKIRLTDEVNGIKITTGTYAYLNRDSLQ